jgi:DNA-binding CsgD family transcriptional regulator
MVNPAEHPSLLKTSPLAHVLRSELMFTSKCGSDASAALIALAKEHAHSDPRLAREMYLEALSAVLFAGRLAADGGVLEVARAAASAPPPSPTARPTDRLLDGLTTVIIGGSHVGVGLVRKAVDDLCCEDSCVDDGTRWLWLACHAAIVAWDDQAWRRLPARHVMLARQAGDQRALPVALHSLAAALAWSGDFVASRQLITEAESITTATATTVFPYAALPLAAWQGDQTEVERLIWAGTHYALARGEGMGLASIDLATALLCNGLGRYEQALVSARRGSEHPQELWANFFLPELIEAATHCGQIREAADALDLLKEGAHAAGSDWAMGTFAYSQALVCCGESAERSYREAIERLDSTELRPAAARARLAYGEWLRRQRRRRDARAQLGPAYEMLTGIGMHAFAERARLELEATGEHVRKNPAAQRSSALTPREAQVATLAAAGATNAEIGAQLRISHNTVAYHLRKVFNKLDVAGRRELARALSRQASMAQQTLT